MIQCVNCGKEFEQNTKHPKKYCSSKCRSQARHKRKGHYTGTYKKTGLPSVKLIGIAKYARLWHSLRPEATKESIRKNKERYHTDEEYRKRIVEQTSKSNRKKYAELRKEVLQKLGGKCVYCGCNISEALEINHINCGGSQETRGKRKTFYKEVLNGQKKDIELVCRVCNSVHWLKFKGITGYKIIWNIKQHSLHKQRII